jgi:hypothetical protein
MRTIQEASIEELEAAIAEKRKAQYANRIAQIHETTALLHKIVDQRKQVRDYLKSLLFIPEECPNKHPRDEFGYYPSDCELCSLPIRRP